MSVLYISTFAQDHLKIYGNKFITAFHKNSKNPLTIYAEGFSIGNSIDFEKNIPQHLEFKNHILSLIDKEKDNKKKSRLKKALRWSYKVYCIIHALETADADYVIWLDGDVQSINAIPQDLAEKLCKNNLLYAYKENLKVQDKIQTHIESGFIIFNKKHPSIKKIIDGYKQGYYQNKILDIPKPWDGFWLYKIISDYNLFSECKLIQPPFSTINTIFKHDVGKSKFENQSIDKHLGRKLLTE